MNLIERLKCRLNIHSKMLKVQDLAIGGELIICPRCNSLYAIHHGRQQCVPFDKDIEEVERSIQEAIARFGE